MKILHLELEGFTCYRKRVEIDFSELELFAITGPTGAGKSSVVDAIIFALYGKVPRVQREIASLVSQGSPLMHVVLEFAVGTQTYTVGRKMQKGKGSAILDMYVDGKRQSVSGITQVNQKVSEILGLDYDAFTRCIILPQGEFAEFLKESGQRQEILTRLLGLEILGKMQKEASQNHEQLQSELALLQARLQGEFSGISPAALQKYQEECAQLDGQMTELNGQATALTRSLQELENVLALRQNLEKWTREQEAAIPKRKKIETLESKIIMARTLLPLLPQLNKFEQTQTQWQSLEDSVASLDQERGRLTTSLQNLSDELQNAEAALAKVPELDKQCDRLQQITPWREQLRNEELSLAKEQELLRQDEKRGQTLRDEIGKRAATLDKLAGEREALTRQEVELAAQRQRWAKFHGAGKWAEMLAGKREAYAKGQQAVRLGQEAFLAKKQAWEHGAAEFETQELAVQKLTQTLQKRRAKKALEEELARMEQALRLQADLDAEQQAAAKERQSLVQELGQQKKFQQGLQKAQDGLEGCTAKLITIAASLKDRQALVDQLQELQEPYRQAREKLAGSEAGKLSLTQAKTRIEAEYQALTTTLQELQRQKEQATQALSDTKTRWLAGQRDHLACAIRKDLHTGDSCPVCGQTVGELPQTAEPGQELLQQLQKELDTRQKSVASLEKKVTDGEAQLAYAQKSLGETEAQIKNVDKELRSAKTRLQKLKKQLQELVASADLETELAKATTACKNLAEEQERLRRLEGQYQGQAREQEVWLENLVKRIQEREAHIANHQKAQEELTSQIQKLTDAGQATRHPSEIKRELAEVMRLENDLIKQEKSLAVLSGKKDGAWKQYLEAQTQEKEVRAEADALEKSWRDKRSLVQQELGLEPVATSNDPGEGERLEAAIVSGVQQWEAVVQASDKLRGQQEQLEKRGHEIAIARAGQESALQELSQALATRRQRVAELQGTIQGLKNKIAPIAQGKDPELWLAELRRQKAKIIADHQTLREERLRLDEKLKHLGQETARLQNVRQELEKQVVGSQKQIEEKLRSLKLESMHQVLAAKASPETLAQWERELAAGRLELNQLDSQLNIARQSLTRYSHLPATVGELAVQITQKREESARLDSLIGSKREQRGRLLQQIQQVEQSLHSASGLESQIAKLSHTEAIQRALALDLQSNRFPAYVMEEALRRLAEDGSVQLDTLSGGRYSFALENRDFYILDHWNEEKPRPSKTLSGGETFIASLALAMALAENIYHFGHKTGGGGLLQSLFIDEGFGTLDGEHLDLVVESLKRLQEKGLTVGVISHLEDLNRYFPSRLAVHKEREGSSVHLQQA